MNTSLLRGSSPLRCLEALVPGKKHFAFVVLALIAAGLQSGCDSASFVPPRPAELSDRTAGKVSSPAVAERPSVGVKGTGSASKLPGAPAKAFPVNRIDLILSHPPATNRQFMVQVLRRETGKLTLSLGVVKPESGEPMTPSRMAGAIRQAVGRGATALLVEPLDAPEVIDALHEAESKGVPLLLLDQALPSRDPGRKLRSISLAGFATSGRKIVEAAIEDEKRMGLPAGGAIALLQNRSSDTYSKQRQTSLTEAVQKLGRAFEAVTFEGDQAAATTALVTYLDAHPKVTMVLTEDDYGLAAALGVRGERGREKKPEFSLAGYASYDVRIEPEVRGRMAGFADRNTETYAIRALQALMDLCRGNSIPERIEIEVPFVRKPPPLFYPAGSEPRSDAENGGVPAGTPRAASVELSGNH